MLINTCKICLTFIILAILNTGTLKSQTVVESKFVSLTGFWKGSGEGFSGNKSIIQSSFLPVMNGTYIEVKNNSKFEPSERYPEGENHIVKTAILHTAKDEMTESLVRNFRCVHGGDNMPYSPTRLTLAMGILKKKTKKVGWQRCAMSNSYVA